MFAPELSQLVAFYLFPLGVMELVLIFLIVVIIFGASKLPQLGRGLGEGISNFRSGLKSRDDEKKDKG